MLEVFVIIIGEYLVVYLEVLSGIQGATLVALVTLGQLLLGRDVEITRCNSKLFHVSLGVDILDALIDLVERCGVLLVLRLGQVLEVLEALLLVYHGIAYQLALRR